MKRRAILLIVLVIGLCTGLFGCAQLKHREFTSFEQDLDDQNLLSVSSFPAWLPEDGAHVPLLYMERFTSEKVYLQVFIRGRDARFGPNANVKSITIHSFAVQLNAGPKIELISNYKKAFWMQGNSNYDTGHSQPFVYAPGKVMTFDIQFSLNGEEHHVQGEMPARLRSSYSPLLLNYLAR